MSQDSNRQQSVLTGRAVESIPLSQCMSSFDDVMAFAAKDAATLARHELIAFLNRQFEAVNELRRQEEERTPLF